MTNAALEEFQTSLNSNLDDKNKLIAMQSIASIYFQMKDYAKAEEWNKKVIAGRSEEQGSLLHAGRDRVERIRAGVDAKPARRRI